MKVDGTSATDYLRLTLILQTVCSRMSSALATAGATPATTLNDKPLALRIHAICEEAYGVRSFDLRPVGCNVLPEIRAGAHIQLRLTNGITRSYSLSNAPDESHRYVIAVNLSANSRGGSRHIHSSWRVGDVVEASVPRCHFPLEEAAQTSVLIAGGIGVTPLLSMASRLDSLGRRWHMHYFARSKEHAAYADALTALAARGHGTLACHFDDDPTTHGDLVGCVAAAPFDAHLYCCGPASMLDAFVACCADRPTSHVHLERFGSTGAPAGQGGFDVTLARSRKTVRIVAGQTILDALLAHGVNVPHACREGVCGSCETRVLDGTPDHRDSVLGTAERASNRTMLVCCSGCRGDSLTLDL
jgi:tetrachlorobenzoquinone reductase